MQTPKKPISKTSRGVRPVRSASKMPKIGKAYKFQDGGKVTGADIRNAKKQAKLERIQSGNEPSTYEKVSNISGNVAKTAASAAQVANAVRDTRSGMSGPGGFKKGGATKYQGGGDVGQPLRPSNFEKRQAKKVGRAQTRAVVANIEGEGTVAQKRDNRASRVSTMAGTRRAKTPKSVSTSTSTSTTDNRNSGNTTNTTNSGAGATGGKGGQGGSGGRSGSSSGVDASRKSSVRQSQDNSRTTNVKNTSNTNVRQSQNNSRSSSKTNYTDNSNRPTTTNTKYTDKSKKSTVDQSRKNYQVGKGNTSTKNSNYKKGGTTKMQMGGAKPKAMYGMSMKPTMMRRGGTKK